LQEESEMPELISSLLDLNPVDYSGWGILQERCTKDEKQISMISSTA